MKKECIQCKNIFEKKYKYSISQWNKALFCSQKCFGESKLGIKRSLETCLKLSYAHKGMKKPWAGKYKHSEEQNKATRKALIDFYSSDKSIITRGKISKANLGKKVTEESRKKMSEGQKLRITYKGGKETRKQRKSFYEQRRKVRKFNNGGSHSLEEWLELKEIYCFTCPCCLKKESEIKLTEDHIIPLSKGGTDEIENIQPLCQECNSRKMTKIIKYDKPT